MKLVREDLAVNQDLNNHGINVSEKDISLFLSGKYEIMDKISCLFANLPIIYNQLLPPNVTLYQYSYSEFSSIEFAIEALFLN